jgi:putative tryptophan/tyrosine transport system substrate-binding protein
MRRREFIGGLGSSVAWPVVATAQQGELKRRIGALTGFDEDDPVAKASLAAFQQRLRQLGWTEGRNMQIDIRFARGAPDLYRKYGAELIGLKPDVILAVGTGIVSALQEQSRKMPIVFVSVVDPIGGGFVESMSRPGGNATGFTNFEYSLAGQWLQLLKQIAPRVTRVAVLRDPTAFSNGGQLGTIQALAPSLGVEIRPFNVRDSEPMQRSIGDFVRGTDGGLIVLSNFNAYLRRDMIISFAARQRLPAVYPDRPFVTAGGLMSYAPDLVIQHQLAATYVDRILKGEKPADLPVQSPTRYETVLNLKTAKALGLIVPETLLAVADEVIQ